LNIRTRLLLLVLAVSLPAVLGFGLLARAIYLKEVEDAQQHVEQAAEDLRLAVEQALERRAEMARVLAASTAVRDGDLRRFHEEASAAAGDGADWVVLVDRQWQLVNTLRPFPLSAPLPRVPNAPFVTDGPALFYTERGPLLQKPVMALFTPQPGVSPPRYNVGVSLPLSMLQPLVEERRYPQGSVAAVINRDQLVLARSRDPDKWIGTQATGNLRQRARSGHTGFAPSVTLDGIASMTYLSKPDRFGCSVVIALPQSALAGAARRLTLQAFAASGALLVIGLCLALYAARRISAAVQALRQAAVQVGRDEIPPRLHTAVVDVDEVGAALHEAGVRIGESTRVLETRVAEAVRQTREAQERLLVAQKHEALGRLTGGIAHDFNNLLQTISTAHHVLDRFATDGPQRRVLDGAMRATSKAAALIRHMMVFGRGQPLAPQPVFLADLLLKSQELTSKALGQRIGLTAAIEPELPALFVDPTQLELALLNLVFNARDAMPDGGHVVIEGRLARPEETAGLGEGRFACLEVSDDGCGMDAHTLERAFDPYFTTKPVGAGSGLGLAQVLSFARSSGGDARIRSAPGTGTRVTLYLPTNAVAAARPDVTPPVPAPTAPLDILMVEDDVLVSSVVKPALEGLGHHVTLYGSADEAAAVLSQGHQFDVLFTDVVMPGTMSGMDLLQWCKANHPALPAVVATGFTTHRLDPGVQVLGKPYGVDELVTALHQACEHG
jgi:signal transduction histidine kinase